MSLLYFHFFNLSFVATFSIFIMFILLISRCGSHCQNEPSRHPSSTFCRCSSAFSRPDIFMLSDHISSPTHLISHISPVSFPRNQSIPRQTFTITNFAMGGERLEVERSKKFGGEKIAKNVVLLLQFLSNFLPVWIPFIVLWGGWCGFGGPTDFLLLTA